jgi:cobalt-zinc-cadmium resistance protein CzcA
VKGVTEVNTIGGFEKQFHIQPDIKKMYSLGITFHDIAEAIARNNSNEGGGYVQQSSQQFLVQANGLLKTIADIEQVPVKVTKTLRTIKIKDIAQVQISTELRNGAALVNAQEAVVGTILMLMGENSRIVSNEVQNELEKISQGLPQDYFIHPLYNRAEMVDATLHTVQKNLIFGSMLVIVTLLLLVGNIPAALVTSSVIPLSLLITFTLMKLKNVSGNLMSLGSLDFGIIIDSAVIVADNSLRKVSHLRKTKGFTLTREEVKKAVLEATLEVKKPAAFGQMVIILVFFPIFALTGIEGKMFTPMATTFVFALLAALVLSFTLVPAALAQALSVELQEKEPILMKMFSKIFGPVLSRSLKYRRGVIGLSLVLLILSFVTFNRMGGEFIPQLDEGSMALDMVRPVGISTDKSIWLQAKTEELIREYPEVKEVFSRLGTSAIPSDPSGINLGDTFISFNPKESWPKTENGRSKTKAQLSQSIAERLQTEVLGQLFIPTQPIQMRFNDLLEGTKADVSIKVMGRQLNELEKVALDLKKILEPIAGTAQVQTQLFGKQALLSVTPKRERMGELGFGNYTLLDPIGFGFKGVELGQLFEGVRSFPIVLRLSHDKRADYKIIKDLPVSPDNNDLVVPMSAVGQTKFEETYHTIFREDSLRRTAVLVTLKNRDVQSYVNEAMKVVEKSFKVPEGVSLSWGGSYKNLEAAKEKLSILVPMTLTVVVLIIYLMFYNWIITAIIFGCVPMSLIGGIFALWIRNMPFSISAAVGMIALAGIGVINGVILIEGFNEAKNRGLHGVSMLKEVTLVLLRPILMTALVDAFGFIPIMISTGLGAEVQRPLATAVVGGIVSSTLLALCVLPAVYLVLESLNDTVLSPATTTQQNRVFTVQGG